MPGKPNIFFKKKRIYSISVFVIILNKSPQPGGSAGPKNKLLSFFKFVTFFKKAMEKCSGLYYKHIMIVIDAASVISK